MRCNFKNSVNRFKFKNKYYKTRHITINPLKVLPPTSNTAVPSLFPLSEAGLDILFSECLYSCCPGCLSDLNSFTFHGQFDRREEPEITQGQVQWIWSVGIPRSLVRACFFMHRAKQLHSPGFLILPHKDTHEKRTPALLQRVARMGNKYVPSEEKYFEVDSWQCVLL